MHYFSIFSSNSCSTSLTNCVSIAASPIPCDLLAALVASWVCFGLTDSGPCTDQSGCGLARSDDQVILRCFSCCFRSCFSFVKFISKSLVFKGPVLQKILSNLIDKFYSCSKGMTSVASMLKMACLSLAGLSTLIRTASKANSKP